MSVHNRATATEVMRFTLVGDVFEGTEFVI